MRQISTALLAVILASAAMQAGARPNTRYLELINRAHDSIQSLAIAPNGGDAFQEMPLGAALHGGGDSTTVEVAGEGCNYDLRFVFRNGRALIYQDVDICRHPRVHIQRMPRTDGKRQARSGQPCSRYADTRVP